ncbi:MAG: PPC domain-containing protein [Pirellulales bacterium]
MQTVPKCIRHGLLDLMRAVALGGLLSVGGDLRAELPSPVLNSVFPAGAQAGGTVSVTVEGADIDELSALRFADPRITSQEVDGNQFLVTVSSDVAPALCDVRVVGKYGVSNPRAFRIGNQPEQQETEPNDSHEQAQGAELNSVLNGRIGKPGDLDVYRFTALAGQRVVLALSAWQIDSPLHGVLEVFDATGRRIAVNRGHRGIDPVIDFRAPANGDYWVKLFDQTYLGGSDYVYRLDFDMSPRVEFVVPVVVQNGQSAVVTLFGQNLLPSEAALAESSGATASIPTQLDQVELSLPLSTVGLTPLPLRPSQVVLDAFAYRHAAGHVAAMIGVTDVPVVRDLSQNHRPEAAQPIALPCEVSGQLIAGDEQDWFSFECQKGEVIWIEVLGERIGSTLDLDIAVIDSEQRELLRLSDDLRNFGGMRFPTNHCDPSGRFVVPATGQYFVLVRNLIGGADADPSRTYRLSVRREEPDFHLTLVPRRSDLPTGLNVWRGGREMAEIIAVRRRGMSGPIRITAENVPAGIECPETWIGPGEDRAPLVLTASRGAAPVTSNLTLIGQSLTGATEIARPVRGGTMVRAGQPIGWGRITEDTPVGVAPESPLLITAVMSQPDVFQGSIVDVNVLIERHTSAEESIQISGVGLPQTMESTFATLDRGQNSGWISLAIPASLPPGPYTFAIQAETEIQFKNGKTRLTTYSNPLTIQVQPGRIRVTVDPRTPRKISRGQTIQVRYQADRLQGFIGKVHTVLAAPGGVVGIRGRGVTFTSQQNSGAIQVIATEDATPGQLLFLRLEAVGTVEDQPIYRGSQFLELGISE